ncbi:MULTISPECIES: LexA family protein [Pseudomonas]|jgi:DNA polymerase V|uniref:LexA family protein n=1 Tax=Pseudomonas TaxID=286 RepID=UPI000680F0DB|nr:MULTISPECIES: translesion error-prone DNA polymerase V autoproteolytic subunit [Pseudomonas]KNH45201.1 DNA polymerase V subunit UmuD [Pseudomonas lini]POA78690.1 DNA polymerase V subunit UmuD [Pseudomonas sp. DP16D-R1]
MNSISVIGRIRVEPASGLLPVFTSKLSCGFPSPAEDLIEEMSSLDDIAVANPPATYLVRSGGDSMIDAGIWPNDVIVVDRSKKAVNRSIVVAIHEGEFVCKRLVIAGDVVLLCPENTSYSPIVIADKESLIIWGVCTFNLHRLCPV